MTNELKVDPEQRKLTLRDIVEDATRNGVVTKIEDYTCYDCPMWRSCDLAFDLYNTNGDCLADK